MNENILLFLVSLTGDHWLLHIGRFLFNHVIVIKVVRVVKIEDG